LVFFQKKKEGNKNYYIVKKTDVQGILNFFYRKLLLTSSLFVFGLLIFIIFVLLDNSRPMLETFGLSNIFQQQWYSADHKYGFLPFITGTLITSIYALIIAIPLSVGISLYISHYISDHRIKDSLKFIIELIAAIPSVIIGLWGIVTLGPFLRPLIPFLLSLHMTLDIPLLGSIYLAIPLFNAPKSDALNVNVFTATIALVIMITPIIVSVSVSIMNQVPMLQKEAAFALGATPWEMSRMTIIPLSTRGIVGAISIGLGRALGETMAVTMLIGNNYQALNSIFDSGTSITSLITNEWAEALTDPLSKSAFLELALILMIMSLIINLIAKLLVATSISTGTGRMEN
jgi:phosphate transport system permease protein